MFRSSALELDKMLVFLVGVGGGGGVSGESGGGGEGGEGVGRVGVGWVGVGWVGVGQGGKPWCDLQSPDIFSLVGKLEPLICLLHH